MSRTHVHVSILAGALALIAAPSLALADDAPAVAPHFGDSGQFALGLNAGFNVNASDVVSGPEIQANYFVTEHLSLGLMVGANWYETSGVNGGASSNSFVFRVGPRIGYDVPLSEYVSFWPQIGVDFRDTNSSQSTTTSTFGSPAGSTVSTATASTTTTAFGLTVVAPIVIHPTKGFFVGAGPAFYTELSNSTSNGNGASSDNGKVTSLGLMATIGGAF